MESIQNPTQEPVLAPTLQTKPNWFIVVFSILGIILLASTILLYFQNQKLKKQSVNQQVSPTIQTPSSTSKTVSPTSISPDETAGWKTYISKCEFEFKYPPFWKVDPYFISDSEVACGYLTGPDYTAGLDSRTGTYITFSRYLIGKDGINTIGDYVHSSEKIIQPKPNPIKSVTKTFGGFSVEEFTGYGYEPGISIVFLKEDYIYNINRSSQTPEKYIDQILSTFKFLDKPLPTVTISDSTALVNGADLKDIKYTLLQGWEAKLNDSLFISPVNGGGYLSIRVYNYPSNIGRREYYCQVSKVCIEGTTYFNEMSLGNISGYIANALDNSGGGAEYFGAKGNKFYIISSYNPPSPNEFEKNYKNVLNSLVF